MRFRSFGSFPSFTGYIGGLSFLRTLAYGIASDLENDLRPYRSGRDEQRRMKRALIEAGILPRPGEKKSQTTPRRTAFVAAAIRPDRPAPPVEIAIRPRPVPEKPKPRLVIPPRSVCADPRQGRPAAISSTGGLRGSLATRRSRHS